MTQQHAITRLEDRLNFRDREETPTHTGVVCGKYYFLVPNDLTRSWDRNNNLIAFPLLPEDREKAKSLVTELDDPYTALPSSANPSAVGTMTVVQQRDTLIVHSAQGHLATTIGIRRKSAPRSFVEKYRGWVERSLNYLIETKNPNVIIVNKHIDLNRSRNYIISGPVRQALEKLAKKHGFEVFEEDSKVVLQKRLKQ